MIEEVGSLDWTNRETLNVETAFELNLYGRQMHSEETSVSARSVGQSYAYVLKKGS